MNEPRPNTDPELVARFRAGDELAFAELMDLYGQNLLAFIRLQNASEAEDICQDTWMKIWRARDQFQGGNFRAWLFKIARNHVIELSRKKRPDLSNDLVDGKAAPAEDEMEVELDVLKQSILGLKPECRELIQGFYFDGSSYEQLGRVLDLPGGTVASRMNRCRQRLREEIERMTQ